MAKASCVDRSILNNHKSYADYLYEKIQKLLKSFINFYRPVTYRTKPMTKGSHQRTSKRLKQPIYMNYIEYIK